VQEETRTHNQQQKQRPPKKGRTAAMLSFTIQYDSGLSHE
jgi:hypothetical protein